MNPLDATHQRWHGRRVAILAERLSRYIPPESRVMDIGCGDGRLAARLLVIRPDIKISGFDVLPRPATAIQVQMFDGHRLPCDDGSVDIALLVDVLHHTEDPSALLKEAARVGSNGVVLKDHVLKGPLAHTTLRFMDWVGNAKHGVSIPYNYWTEEEWRSCFAALGLRLHVWQTDVRLYPWPASILFDRSLHVITRLSACT
jgi:ubiquinone/menaquinone biosynthesis C-methylase UbiE